MKKIAIVTGASSGMGRDFVLELLKKKSIDEIWMIARRKERLFLMEAKCPTRLKALSLDLTEESSFQQLEKLLSKEPLEIEVLVNAAGMGRMGKVEAVPWQEQGNLIDLNVKALTCMTHICLPYMPKNSHIIQLCSGSAFLPQPGFASYAASKSYVLSFSRALRTELRKQGISVTAVCPGPVNTEFFQAAGTDVHPAKKRFMSESKDVVKKAMKDADAGKELSIYGTSMKMLHVFSKFIPTNIFLKITNQLLK